MKKNFGVYIGRFQPFHIGHLDVCIQAFKKVKHLIIVLGSSYAAPSIRNPFTCEQRKAFITAALNAAGFEGRFSIVAVPDFLYSRSYVDNDLPWVTAIQQLVAPIVSLDFSSTALVGLIPLVLTSCTWSVNSSIISFLRRSVL